MKERIFELWCGHQGSGKTYRLKRRALFLASRSSIRSVFILDFKNDYVAEAQWFKQHAETEVFRSMGDLVDYVRENDGHFPRICICRCEPGDSFYMSMLDLAIIEGSVALIIDEIWLAAPSGARWTGAESLQKIVLAGRNLENANGDLCKVHLLVAVQYPRSAHALFTDQCRVIKCSRMEGERSKSWVKDNFGQKALSDNQRLGPHQFQDLRGHCITH
jgi:hypothetical protein